LKLFKCPLIAPLTMHTVCACAEILLCPHDEPEEVGISCASEYRSFSFDEKSQSGEERALKYLF